MLRLIKLLLVCFSLTAYLSYAATSATPKYKSILDDISKIYLSSMVFIFTNQNNINQVTGDKEELFGENFIKNIKQVYKVKYNEEFPQLDHHATRLLVESMVEVMKDNKALIYDPDIGFKGLIPATFAFQISRKLSIKGIGLRIRFTRSPTEVRNVLNAPDEWEISIIEKMRKSPKVFYNENGFLNNRPAVRQVMPFPMQPYCLNCHGTKENSPLNKNVAKEHWTDIDMTGFKMENWTMEDFGGIVSFAIEKSGLN